MSDYAMAMDDFTSNDFLEGFDAFKNRKKRAYKTKRIKTQFNLASRLISLPRKARSWIFKKKIPFVFALTLASFVALSGSCAHDPAQKDNVKRYKITVPDFVKKAIPKDLAKKFSVAPKAAPAPQIKTAAKASAFEVGSKGKVIVDHLGKPFADAKGNLLNEKGERLIPEGADTKEPIAMSSKTMAPPKQGFADLISKSSFKALPQKMQAQASNFDNMTSYQQMAFLKEASFALSMSNANGTTHDGINLVILGWEKAKEHKLTRTTIGLMLGQDMLDLIEQGKIKKIKKATSLADKKIDGSKSKVQPKTVVASKSVPEAFKTVISVGGFNALSANIQKELRNAKNAGPQTQIRMAKEVSAKLLKQEKKASSEDAARIIDWGIKIAKDNKLLDDDVSKMLLSDMAYMHATGKGGVGIDLVKAATLAYLAGMDDPYTKKLIPYLQKIAPKALVEAEQNFVYLKALPAVRAQVAKLEAQINKLDKTGEMPKPAKIAKAKITKNEFG